MLRAFGFEKGESREEVKEETTPTRRRSSALASEPSGLTNTRTLVDQIQQRPPRVGALNGCRRPTYRQARWSFREVVGRRARANDESRQRPQGVEPVLAPGVFVGQPLACVQSTSESGAAAPRHRADDVASMARMRRAV